MNTTYLEILFAAEVTPGDLEIIFPATAHRPGRVRLLAARLGEPQPDAPNSRPALSAAGPKFGFIAPAALFEQPFDSTYHILAETNGRKANQHRKATRSQRQPWRSSVESIP